MAASVYATPPPDLSGEEAALSDASNSSQTNSSHGSALKASKRTLSSSFLSATQNSNTTSQLSSDSLPDLSKKRRKQSMPIRISANGGLDAAGNRTAASAAAAHGDMEHGDLDAGTAKVNEGARTPVHHRQSPTDSSLNEATLLEEQQNNFQKIFLSNLSQLQQKHLSLQQEDGFPNSIPENFLGSKISSLISLGSSSALSSASSTTSSRGEHEPDHESDALQGGSLDPKDAEQGSINGPKRSSDRTKRDNHPHLDRDTEDDEERPKSMSKGGSEMINDDKLTSLGFGEGQREPSIDSPRLMLKKEFLQDPEWDGEIRSNLPKPEDWISIAGLPFPFPPEAAAALSASGYLPQLPLLGVPAVTSFSSGDTSNRSNVPPLRIFNPEAYCDLCNKEFCNKYFLKTHKANKHGIYEPATSGSESTLPNMSPFNPIHQLSQVLQLQQQSSASQEPSQEKQPTVASQPANPVGESVQPPPPPPPVQPPLVQPPPAQSQKSIAASSMRAVQSPKVATANHIQPSVFCDICFKKFSSLSAMRKHRSKAHEVSSNHQLQQQLHHHQQQQLQQQQQHLQQQLQQHLQQQQLQLQSQQNKHPVDAKVEVQADTGADQHQVAFQMPDGFREDYSVEQEDASFTPQPRKLSALSIQAAKDANFSADKLKRLGVTNPEAFCEICCKEYCNKYFLRTHKLKRHGVFPTAEEIKEERNPWSFVQTSPLNLIMGNTEGHTGGNGLPVSLKKQTEPPEDLGSKPFEIKQELLKGNSEGNESEEPNGELDVEEKQPKDGSDEDAEAISVDLQKLQSMIMQLNDLNNQRKMSCGVCGKELENQYLLHAHMIQEHGNMAENNNGVKGSREATPLTTTSPSDFEVCKQCDKEFSNVYMLKQHLIEVHGVPNASPKRDGFITPERPTTAPSAITMPAAPNYAERKPTYSMTPTSSYCEICNKELCNKYFMKTHMQRMHGIEIENGAQIGGVVCNICNKELCSKYFLRVHKHNTHGIVEEGAPLPQPRQNGESQPAEPAENSFAVDGMLKPGEISDLSNRYYSHFTEVCPLCSRRFRSAKWLRAHLLSDHGKPGVEKLKEIEHKLGSGSGSKSTSPSLKVPNGLNLGGSGVGGGAGSAPSGPGATGNSGSTSSGGVAGGSGAPSELPKFGSKPPFGIGTIPDAKFLPKNPIPALFGTDQVASPMSLKGYQCSYCSFATPLLPLLFIHERSHSSLNIVQQQLLQQEERDQVQLAANFPLLKSESAVSLAKDSAPHMVPTSSTASSSETPCSTPASTPIPSLSQEALNLQQTRQTASPEGQPPFDRESSPLTHHHHQQRSQHQQHHQQQQQQHQQHQHETASSYSGKQPDSPKSEPSAVLSEMANLTQRPAVYALPQQTCGPLMMQSFLIEESTNALLASGGGGVGGGGGGSSSSNSNDGKLNTSPDHRFVPAVVFLPVKERILSPMTISFNLSPA